MRWEGNDQVLRDFDAAVGTSVRPALITQLTGSSIGSPVGNIAGARVVGNMLFDPTRMCWVSTLPPEDEEPDVFAELADDEDEHQRHGDDEAKRRQRQRRQGDEPELGDRDRQPPQQGEEQHRRIAPERRIGAGERGRMAHGFMRSFGGSGDDGNP